MKDWWMGLAQRERFLLAGAGLFLTVVLAYVLLIRPLYAETTRASNRVEQKLALLSDARAAAGRLGGSVSVRTNPIPGQDDVSLVVIVDRTARSNGLAPTLKRNQPITEREIRVRLENAPFDQLMQWLGLLQRQYGIDIQSASFDGATETGVVTSTLILERPG